MDNVLERCVGDPDEFFANTLGREHLYLKDRLTVDELPVSLAEIDQVVAGTPLPLSSVVLAHKNRVIDPDVYRAEFGPEYQGPKDTADPVKVTQLIESGATLVIRPASLHLARLRTWCKSFERGFGHGVDADVFITPPGSRGFEIHADAAESFVIQLAGTKSWEVFNPVVPWQHQSFGVTPPDGLTLAGEYRLEPGDVLYVPRGMPHLVQSTDRMSVHVTISVNTIRWSDLLSALTKTVFALPELQAPLPMGSDPAAETVAMLPDRLRTVAALLDKAGSDRSVIDRIIRTGDGIGDTLRPGLLSWQLRDRQVDVDSVIRVCPGSWPIVHRTGGDSAIGVGASRFPVSTEVAASCQELLTRRHMPVAELAADPQTATDTARVLVKLGIAQLEPNPSEAS